MRSAAVLPVPVLFAGCVGLFASGSGSVSVGSHAKGALLRPMAVPFEGAGYQVHPEWRGRDHRYTTEEVGRWITGVFSEVTARMPGSVAYLGDLSSRRGGDAAMHRSHSSGRDVDVFFFACNDHGDQLSPLPAMLHFSDDGRADRWSPAGAGRVVAAPVPSARFDARRNWALVRAMLSNPTVQVQWIFVDRALTELILAEAEREGEDPSLVLRALVVLHQPTDSQPHDDHMHVRLFCDPGDRFFGCNDKGPKRWLKKHWKYMRSAQARS
jgi:penicillin-insensitive murein DD-endopeptidase